MPDWMTALTAVGLLCLPLAPGICQSESSLAHYRLGEEYLRQDNLQTAANEFREALNGDLEPKWTGVWSHIQLGRIFDVTGQHDRAVNEYRQAVRTGDNTNGALDEAMNYLQHAEHAIYLPTNSPPIRSVQPIQKTDPEYTAEARLAELEGTVVLHGTIGEDGFAHELKVGESLGLGLDEKAMEAVKQWHFQPAAIVAEIRVEFRLPSKQSRWHLIQVQFQAPPGAARPVFVNALYPIGAGIGPEAMEEGRVLVAIGRLATAKLTFVVDEHGVPGHFQIVNSSEPVWASEATALVGQWRFTPGTANGIGVPMPCTVELVWGEKELTSDLERQLHEVLAAR